MSFLFVLYIKILKSRVKDRAGEEPHREADPTKRFIKQATVQTQEQEQKPQTFFKASFL